MKRFDYLHPILTYNRTSNCSKLQAILDRFGAVSTTLLPIHAS